MSSTAQFAHFGPYWYSGVFVTGPLLYHYAAGSTVLKDCWADHNKTVTLSQPIIGDANGLVSGYFDGLYKLHIIHPDTGATIALYPDYQFAETPFQLTGSLAWDPTLLYSGGGQLQPGSSVTSPGITVTGATTGDFVLVSAPYTLQGLSATAYVSGSDTVTILLYNLSGVSVDLASGTWRVRVLQV